MKLCNEREEHESYALIGCSRVTGTARNLFGSSIRHANTVTLKIKTAVLDRHLNMDWYHGRKGLIEVEMSQTQFAEMITSLNMGDGVPCTLRYFNGERKENPPATNQRLKFEQEFGDSIKGVQKLYDKEYNDVQQLLSSKGAMKVADKKKIGNFLFKLTRIVDDNIPFIQKSFNEAMDKTVSEAKGEVEAFTMNKIASLGIKGLEKEMLKLGDSHG